MEQSELKPCPFCGGTANFFLRLNTSKATTKGWEFGICCTKCNVTTPRTNYRLEVSFGALGNVTTVIDERPLAVEAWNRREGNEQN